VLPNNRVWIAEAEGNLAGFIAFANGWVNHLYVAPAFQRQGREFCKSGFFIGAIRLPASQGIGYW